MNIINIEPYLIASRPEMPHTNTHFVGRTMNMLRANHPQAAKRPLLHHLTHLPKMALIALIVAGLTLVSGAAYAVYSLWIKPTVTTSEVRKNQYGRTEVVTNLNGCLRLKDKDKAVFEIKQGSTLPASEVASVVQARCELERIRKWVAETNPMPPTKNSHAFIDAGYGASEFESMQNNTITLKDGQTGELNTFAFTSDARFIDQGYESDRSAFKKGDSITLITYREYDSESGWPTRVEVRGIIKMSLPVGYYSMQKQNSIVERTPCDGNRDDTCFASNASIDLYPHNEGSSDITRPQGNIFRDIQGKLISHSGATFIIQGSSGATYTVTTPRDIIKEFNTQYSKNYDGLQVKIGDSINVRYMQFEGSDPKKIASSDISQISLTIELIKKDDPLKKY